MNPLDDGWLGWAIALAVGVPVVLVVLTEIIGVMSRRNHPAASPLRLLRNWVVPVAALLALVAFAFQSPAEQVWARVIATVLGFLVILLVLSAFNVALFANARKGSWRERIPSIFVDIARLALIVVGLAILFQWVWGADVGGLIAALGVTSIVIGLALQNAVGGVISGLLLLFEQPFKIGDWLDVGGLQGRVIQVNWRAVHIDTGSGIQIVPNSSLADASFTNLSKPQGPFNVTTSVSFASDDPPHQVVAVLLEVAHALPMKAADEQPSARYAGAGNYTVTLPIVSPAQAEDATSLYLAWLWYSARRHNLALDGDSTDPLSDPDRLDEAVSSIAPTLHLTEETRPSLLATGRLQRYGAGEVVQAFGVVPSEIRFIVEGRVRVAIEVAGGQIDFGVAETGDYVGQTALTREPSMAWAVAATVTTVLVVPVATIDALVQQQPLLAREIGQSIELKRKLASEARSAAIAARDSFED